MTEFEKAIEEMKSEMISTICERVLDGIKEYISESRMMNEKSEDSEFLCGIRQMSEFANIPYSRMRHLIISGKLDGIIKKSGTGKKIYVQKGAFKDKMQKITNFS